jgi:Ras-related GTP-binding protein C/D
VYTGSPDAAYADSMCRYLALVCIMGEDSPAEKKAIIDYNVGVFQAGLKKVFPKSDREAQVEIVATNDGSM